MSKTLGNLGHLGHLGNLGHLGHVRMQSQVAKYGSSDGQWPSDATPIYSKSKVSGGQDGQMFHARARLFFSRALQLSCQKGALMRKSEITLFLTETEQEALVLALAQGQQEFSHEDALKIVAWAVEMRMGALLLQMVLEGKVALYVSDGSVKVGSRSL